MQKIINGNILPKTRIILLPLRKELLLLPDESRSMAVGNHLESIHYSLQVQFSADSDVMHRSAGATKLRRVLEQ